MSRSIIRTLQQLFSQIKYRSWIRRQLNQAGGREYLARLERDIGAEPGHFQRELQKGLIRRRPQNGDTRPASWPSSLPVLRFRQGRA